MKMPHRFRRSPAALLVVSLLAITLSGCNYVGYVAHAVAGDRDSKVDVPAEYRGLADKSVAVLVAADAQTLYQYPGSDRTLINAISGTLMRDVQGVNVLDPEKALNFQRSHPYWNAMPYSDLSERLGVERLVVVDVVEYATHAAGNTHEWRGKIIANIGVAESDGPKPNDFAYASIIRVDYPNDRELGLINSSSAAIEAGMLQLFSEAVTARFHTHQRDTK